MHIVFADAHVHIYDEYDLDTLWDSAWQNFSDAAARLHPRSSFTGILFLTESARYNRFEELFGWSRSADGSPAGKWQYQPTNEQLCIRVANGKKALYVVAGRQIATTEGLEVLGLGTDRFCPDGGKLTEGIKFIAENGGLPVLPWGAGKWCGHRLRIVSKILSDSGFPVLHWGDNGNRPIGWPLSLRFVQKARRHGRQNLPGSDPLPFSSEQHRIGGFGFFIIEKQAPEKPFHHLLLRLANGNGITGYFGNRIGFSRFFIQQNRLLCRKFLPEKYRTPIPPSEGREMEYRKPVK